MSTPTTQHDEESLIYIQNGSFVFCVPLFSPLPHHSGAYDVMASKHLRSDVNYAWPGAEVAVSTYT